MTIKSAYHLTYHQGHPELESLPNNVVGQSIVNYHPFNGFVKKTITRNDSNLIISSENTNIENSLNSLLNVNIIFLRILNPLPDSIFTINDSYSEIEWIYYPYGLSVNKFILIYNTGSIYWEGDWSNSDTDTFKFDVEYLYYFKNSSTILTKREELIQIKLYKENEIKTKLNINNLKPLEDIEIISCFNIQNLKITDGEGNIIIGGNNNLKLKIYTETGNIEIISLPLTLTENDLIATLLIKPIRTKSLFRFNFFDPPETNTPYQNTIFTEENLNFLNQQESTINYNNITIPNNIEYLYFLYNGIGSIKITIKSKVEENEKIKSFYNNQGQLVLVGKNGKDFKDSLDLSISGKGSFLRDFVLWGVYNVD